METSGTGRKLKKKRKLIIDEQKLIPSDTMRAQLRRAADLLVPLELAPPTKRLMEWKDVGGVDKLLTMPGMQIRPTRLRQVTVPMERFVGENVPVVWVGENWKWQGIWFGKVEEKRKIDRGQLWSLTGQNKIITPVPPVSAFHLLRSTASRGFDCRSARLSKYNVFVNE